MALFYGGDAYEIQNIQFDLIGQMYCAYIKQFRVLNFWRRDAGNIGIKTKDIWIYINTSTPHIEKMISDGKSANDICYEIGSNIISYIDYALCNKNTNWVRFVESGDTMIIDRIREEDIAQALNIQEHDKKCITIFNAY